MTTFPAMIDKIVHVLTEAMPDRLISDGPIPEYQGPYNGISSEVIVGWSDSSDPAVSEIVPEGLAGSGREAYNIRCTINSYLGDMVIKSARDESMKLFREVKSILQGVKWNKEVDGVMRVYIGLVAYDASFNDGSAISRVEFNVTVEGFADYGT